MVVVEMTLESIASTELLAAASNHHPTPPGIRFGVCGEVIVRRVLYRNPAANPLCRSLETSVSTDMTLEVRGAVVALYPLAVGTSPGVVFRYRGWRNISRDRLDVARMWGMARSFGMISAPLLRRNNSGAGSGTNGSASLSRAQSGRRNIFIF